MSLVTTCPACGTAFRVTPEQLSAHRGDVRCGHCQRIFSALKHLAEVAPGTQQPAREAAPETNPIPEYVPDTALMDSEEQEEPDLATVHDPAPEHTVAPPSDAPVELSIAELESAESPPEELVTDPVLPEQESVAETAPAASATESAPLSEDESALPATGSVQAEPLAEEPAEIDPALHAFPVGLSELPESTAEEPAAAESLPADLPAESEAGAGAEAEEIVLESPASATAATPAAPASPPFAKPKKRSSRWLVPLTVLLVLAAGAQSIYFLRTEIASHLPQSKPWLVAACGPLHCRVELPRQADLLSIEDSDLQDDPEHEGVLILASTLHNRASYAQAYPLLELTLTDTFDKPVLRRTLEPREYLPAGTALADGLAAGVEINVRLHIGVDGAKPAGYRLYVRY